MDNVYMENMRPPGIEPQVYIISIPTQIIFYLCVAKGKKF